MLGDTARSASRPSSSSYPVAGDIISSANGVSSGGRSNSTSARSDMAQLRHDRFEHAADVDHRLRRAGQLIATDSDVARTAAIAFDLHAGVRQLLLDL